MKRIVLILSVIMLSVSAFAQQPKYVFYFIGDGMGANAIQLTELFRASMKGELGTDPLCMTQFPVATMSTHFSANRNTTDSAASGTALATGKKTNNGRIGIGPDGEERYMTIAEMAARSGKKVGIVTTTGINHATPAAFSAHQPDRGMYYEIALDQIENGFDFYAGAAIYKEDKSFDGKKMDPIRPKFEAAGYTICNYQEFQDSWQSAEKVLMLPGKGQAVTYNIDTISDGPENQDRHLTLSQMVESAITFLMKDNKKGFFLMAEGSEVDHGAHSNDAATTIQEIIDLDNAVRIAFEFYKKYPKQTLIVVTSDHDTGSLALLPGNASDLTKLSFQKHSLNVISDMMKAQINKDERALSWEETKIFLEENFGLWTKVPMTWDDEKMLRDIYETTVARRQAGSVKDLYADNAKIAAAAMRLLNNKSRVFWQSGSHSAAYTPVFAIGAGSEKISHKTDNAVLCQDIMKIMGLVK